ncbi:N-acetylneuraminate lyase-like isoform X2 [Achroia grisella]|uniref:N-acetylneuraminate lyase-like isoform X2 n=1 Tax=Achroia grisella TaxID=688607 RepID=UPI0027D21752|nr:N-acetylneuraminate lyase-like isoform X2 [Achroia grisella]
MGLFDIEGIIAPVFTPIDDKGNINTKIIPEYAQYLHKHGIKGILVGGTTGEAVSLSLEERKDVLLTWINEAQPLGIKVISQVGGVPLTDVLAMASYSEEVGANCIMTLPELYFRPRTCEELVSYLELVSKAAPTLPLLYYHYPMISRVDFNMAEFFEMASSRISNFKGMKADLDVAVQVADQLHDDQKIFIAYHLLAPAVLLGHDSSISTITNLLPGLVQDVVETTKSHDVVKARNLQEKLNKIVKGITIEDSFVPAMKVAMELITGIRVGPPRLPLLPLNETSVARIADHIRSSGYDL